MTWLQTEISRRLTRLKACSKEDFSQAGIEVAIICFSAYLPIWLGIVIFSLTTLKGSVGHFTVAIMTSGEALLIACGVIGPLIYIITKRYGGLKDPLTLRFPYGAGLSILILFIWAVAGGVFVLEKMNELHLLNDIIDKGAMWNISWAVTLASIALLYFATVFRNNMDNADAAVMMHDDQEKFVQEFTNG